MRTAFVMATKSLLSYDDNGPVGWIADKYCTLYEVAPSDLQSTKISSSLVAITIPIRADVVRATSIKSLTGLAPQLAMYFSKRLPGFVFEFKVISRITAMFEKKGIRAIQAKRYARGEIAYASKVLYSYADPEAYKVCKRFPMSCRYQVYTLWIKCPLLHEWITKYPFDVTTFFLRKPEDYVGHEETPWSQKVEPAQYLLSGKPIPKSIRCSHPMLHKWLHAFLVDKGVPFTLQLLQRLPKNPIKANAILTFLHLNRVEPDELLLAFAAAATKEKVYTFTDTLGRSFISWSRVSRDIKNNRLSLKSYHREGITLKENNIKSHDLAKDMQIVDIYNNLTLTVEATEESDEVKVSGLPLEGTARLPFIIRRRNPASEMVLTYRPNWDYTQLRIHRIK